MRKNGEEFYWILYFKYLSSNEDICQTDGEVVEKLREKGVPRELWDEALEELPEAGGQIDAFLTARLRGRMPDQREKKRLTDALLRRGFSWGEVRSAWLRQGQELPEA